MNWIIYVEGKMADHLGRDGMKSIGQQIANRAGCCFDMLTHGPSQYHANVRLTFEPEKGQ